MKTLQKISVGTLICFTALLTSLNFTSRAQTNNGVRPPPDDWLMLNPVFADNPATRELVTNLLAAPQPELSVPQFSQAGSAPGTYWTLKGAAAPLPFDPYPDLPVYSLGTNGQYLIDDRSVDYPALEAQQQAEDELLGLTNPPISINPINTNGLWLEVPADSLADVGQFKVILHNAIQGQSYDFLTTPSLNSPITWATELTTNNPSGNSIEVELPMNGNPILFVRARVTESYSFYINTPPMSQDVYDGDSVTFYVNTGGNTNLTFQWTFNGVAIPGATNSSYTIDSVQDSDAGYYAVIISDGTNSLVTPAAQLTTEGSTGDANLIPVTSGRQNYTFKSGVTYYIGSQTYLYGNTTIEGGAVLKFDWNYNSSLVVMGGLTCKTEPYNPAILTTIDDDAVGEYLGFSSSDPQTAANGTPYLDMTYSQSNSISNLRVCFADWGVTTPLASRKLDVWDCQFVECNYGLVNLVAGTGADDSLHNVLFAACGAAVGASSNSVAIDGEQVTADVGDFCLANVTPGSIALTNSIVWGNSITASNLSTVNVASNPDGTNFVYEGNGSYYLAANSPLHKAGTANISSRLQAELQNKTTYSPVPIAANIQITGSLTLFPQALRYTNGAPDIGYYYDALDYSVANVTLSGGNITVLPGTAIAVRNDYIAAYDYYTVEGFLVQQGSTFTSHGTPTKPNVFTAEKMVQEFPETGFAIYQVYYYNWWFGTIAFASDFEFDDYNSPAPTFDFRFSKFYLPANDYHIWSGMDEYGEYEVSPDSSIYLSLQDCQVHGGRINLGNPDYYNYDPSQVYAAGAVSLLNNSFENVSINLDPTYNEYGYGINCDEQVVAYNNLFKGGLWLHLEPFTSSAGNWIFTDNLFDHADLVQDVNEPLDYNYNGYWPLSADELTYDYNFYPWYVNNTNQLQTTTTGDGYTDGGNEVTLSSAPPYQHGTFGKFYLPDTTPLYGAGSRSPADAGLYQYTTRTDQTKEGSETSGHMVNIGLHYVAANNYGQPKDSDGDGIPDYVEDANGNGQVDFNPIVNANETDPNNPMTDGITNDIYNTAYDNIDLSGDGLVGRIKKALGINPLDTSNPLSFTQITTGEEPEVATFEVPISYNALTNMGGLKLLVDGNVAPYQECDPATDGNCLLEWNTTFNSPGQHYLQVQLTVNGQIHQGDSPDPTILAGVGKIGSFYSTNICQFDPFYSRFNNSGATLYAALPEPDANYTIELQTTNGVHIKTIANSTSSGIIMENWDLTDDNGNPVTDDTIKAVFNVSLLDPSSGSLEFLLHRALLGDDGNFTISYTWDVDYYAHGTMHDAIENGVVDPLISPLESGGSGSFNPYFSTFNDYTWSGNLNGNPGYLSGQSDVNNLITNLTDVDTMDFYFEGHGNPSTLGDDARGQVSFFNNQVGFALGNLSGKSGATPQHPYRFVFLNACDTADDDGWAHAFGIPDKITGAELDNGSSPPQAFVGWKGEPRAPNSDDDWNDVAETYTIFFSAWQNGYNLQECIDIASSSNPLGDGSVTLNFPLGKRFNIFQNYYGLRGLNNFHINVYGYRGIKRVDYDDGY
jgi:hypothetical protein